MTAKNAIKKINNRQLAIYNDLEKQKLQALLQLIRPDFISGWFGRLGSIYYIDQNGTSWDNIEYNILSHIEKINASELLNLILIDSGASDMFPIY